MAKRTLQVGQIRAIRGKTLQERRLRRAVNAAAATEVQLAPSLQIDRRGRLAARPARVDKAALERAQSRVALFAEVPGEGAVATLNRLIEAHNQLLVDHQALLTRYNALLEGLERSGSVEVRR